MLVTAWENVKACTLITAKICVKTHAGKLNPIQTMHVHINMRIRVSARNWISEATNHGTTGRQDTGTAKRLWFLNEVQHLIVLQRPRRSTRDDAAPVFHYYLLRAPDPHFLKGGEE